MIPEYPPRGTSITYGDATVMPPVVYHMSLKPATSTLSPSSTAAITPDSPTTTPIVFVHNLRPTISNSSSTGALATSGSATHARRNKCHSESALRLERMLASAAPPRELMRRRPYSAGDELDLVGTVTISGYSKNSHGTWVFKVDVGGPSDTNAYVVRRRFTDFKLLHEGLSELCKLPELPPHGIFSVVQMFVSPEKLLAARVACLQKMLLVIRAHPTLSKSEAFIAFIGKNPSRYDAGYVSLSGYEVPASQCPRPAGSLTTK
ncbi:Phox homologous domain [Plasmopara halstedii]|uniref:Phox homologous domain n=1 Tax=Plasmopara halstedii TaxID=4781 RepID=A0A0P1B6T4_PLAHL|nr:Phox homologous domain [Plasmopara halstedii]CEG49322.1 Phox homologous domain [Plasmopara halstedii]|eukprot:XP_024585691.1 Phox homologous domain [Plasmopara halstedii]